MKIYQQKKAFFIQVISLIFSINICTAQNPQMFENKEKTPLGIVISSVNVVNVTPCYGGNSGAMTINVSGGQIPYQYSKDGGNTYQMSNVFSGLSAGGYNVYVKDAYGAETSTYVNINQPAQIIVNSPAHTNVTGCYGNTNGAITISASGGTGALTYTIDNGTPISNSNGHFSGLGGGTYNTLVTDAVGCSVSGAQVVVIQPAQLLIISQTANPVTGCYGYTNGSIDITSSGGTIPVNYSIDGGTTFQTSPHFSGLPSGGPHQIIVKDANSCSVTGSILYITQPDLLQISSENYTDVTTCNGGDNGTIILSATGGTGDYQYSIDGGNIFSVSPNFTGLTAGTYSVKIHDANSCYATGSTFILTQPTVLSVNSVDTTNITGCFGDNTGKIVISASGGTPPLKYSIDGGGTYQTSDTFNNLIAGGYQITVQDAHSCTTQGNYFYLQQPTKLVATQVTGTNIYSCFDGNDGTITVVAYGGVSPLKYSIDNGSTYPYTNNFITGLTAGTYTVKVKDFHNCTAIPPSNVIQLTAPNPVVINGVVTTDPICFGSPTGQIEISASGGTGTLYFSANNGANYWNNNTVTGLSAGTPYIVSVKDGHGCTTIGSTYTLNQPPDINISNVNFQNVTSCYGGNNGFINITASGGVPPLLYSINGGATFSASADSSGLAAGGYWIVVKDANGCTKTGNQVILNQPDPLKISYLNHTDVNACNGDSAATLTINYTGGTPPVEYSVGNGILSQIDNGYFINLPAGIYYPLVKDANLCTATGQVTTITQPPVLEIFVDNASSSVSCSGNEDGVIILHGTGGQLAYSYSIDNGTIYQSENSFTGLASGIYPTKIKDAYNCIIAGPSLVINEPAAVVIDSVKTTNVLGCYNDASGAISIYAKGGTGSMNYSVNSGNNYFTSSVFTNLYAGNYSVKVRDQNLCTTLYNQVVTLYQPGQITINSIQVTNVKCRGEANGEIHFSATGGTGNYLYSIDNGQNFFDNGGDFLNLSGGEYKLTVEDANHCIVHGETRDIYEPDSLRIFQVNHTDEKCIGTNDGSITINPIGGTSPFTYSLDGITYYAVNVFGNLIPGTYKIYLKDASGCSAVGDSVIILIPESSALFTTDTTQGCPPLKVKFTKTSGGSTYRWDFGDGQTAAYNSPTHYFENSSATATNYTVTAFAYSNTGCHDTARTVITVFPRPGVNFTATPYILIYPDTVAQLTNLSTADVTDFYWNFGDGTNSILPNPSTHSYFGCGTYNISLAGFNGQCRDTAKTTIYLDPRELKSIIGIDTTFGCTPVTVKLSNLTQNGSQWQWNLGDGTTSTSDTLTKIYDLPGKYYIKLKASGDCGTKDSTSTMVEVFGSPKVGFTAQPDSVMPPSQPVHCYNNSDTGTYLWNFGDGTISAETEPIHFYQNVTGYFHISLTVISQNGCVDSLKLSDSVYVMPIGFVKFPDAFSPNNDGLNDVFKPVAAKSIKNYDLKIYNNWGMLVFTSGKPENGWDGKYQNTIVAPGVYMWILNGTYANGKPFTESGNVTVIFPQK